MSAPLITGGLLRGLGVRQAPESWAAALDAACAEFDITTPKRAALFVANVVHECGGFTELRESMNYAASALTNVFGPDRISMSQALALGRTTAHPADQQGIANLVYGGAWGRRNLGNTEPGDGWKFRGAGPMQNTGRANHAAIGELVGIPVDEVPDYLLTPIGGARAAAAFWHAHDCNPPADRGDVITVRRIINGKNLGLANVTMLYHQALAAMPAGRIGL